MTNIFENLEEINVATIIDQIFEGLPESEDQESVQIRKDRIELYIRLLSSPCLLRNTIETEEEKARLEECYDLELLEFYLNEYKELVDKTDKAA